MPSSRGPGIGHAAVSTLSARASTIVCEQQMMSMVSPDCRMISPRLPPSVTHSRPETHSSVTADRPRKVSNSPLARKCPDSLRHSSAPVTSSWAVHAGPDAGAGDIRKVQGVHDRIDFMVAMVNEETGGVQI